MLVSCRGIEWVSLTSFLSFATSVPNNLGLVRNELQHVDLRTGKAHTHYTLVFYPDCALLDLLVGCIGMNCSESESNYIIPVCHYYSCDVDGTVSY